MNTKLYTLIATVALGLNAEAALFDFGQTVNMAIPDNNLSGIAETINVGSSGIQSISDVTVSLNISSGFNGDYYAYLLHDGVLSVLLNRVGLNPSNPYGASDLGLNITLSDSAPNGDIHNYPSVSNPHGGALTGTWQPDARNVSPFAVTAGTPRSAFLRSFDGGGGDGSWTLFIADTSEGGIGTLNSWSVEVTGTGTGVVPEGGNTSWLLGAAMIALLGVQRVFQRRAGRSLS